MTATVTDIGAPYALAPDEGDEFRWFGSTLRLKAAHPALGALASRIEAGDEPPMHVHANEDEWLVVTGGEVTFYAGELAHRGGPGTFVYFPRGVPHTFTIESGSAQVLVLAAPGGFERMFERAPSTPDEAVAALQAFGMEVVGPNPRELRQS
jgi:quercetin dioxygenase-like cupin family protein